MKKILCFLTASTVAFSQASPGALGPPYGTGAGTAQAHTVSFPQPYTIAANAPMVCWKPSNSNTGAAPTLTITANGVALTATAITKNGSAALVAGDIVAGTYACVVPDGTQFQLQNPQTTVAGDYKYSDGYTGSIAMTSSDVTIYTTTTIPALSTGACLLIDLGVGSNQGTTWRLKVDGTTIATLFSPGGVETDFYLGQYCNDRGSQTAQHLDTRWGGYWAAVPAPAGVSFVVNSGLAVPFATVPVNWSTTHVITITALATSGSVIGNHFRIGL